MSVVTFRDTLKIEDDVIINHSLATAGKVGVLGSGDDGSGSSGARRVIKDFSNPTLVCFQTQYLPILLNVQSLVE